MNVPVLRFKEFSDKWQVFNLEELSDVKTGNKDTQNRLDDGEFPFFVRSQTVEKINSYAYDGEAVLTSGDGVGVGKNFHYINGKFDYHQRVYCIFNFKSQVSGKYIFYYFSEKFNKRVMGLSAKNSVDSVRRSMITEMPISIPTLSEQTKIANFLTAIDEKITQLTKKHDLLNQYKKGVMQQIFSQELRFKDDDGQDFPEWEEATLGDVLDYEQPTKYLVSSTEYSDDFKTPVLTAGKTFILGYTDETAGICEQGLPVIIFDDFTTAFKFVSFPFKAKSSAMKILRKKAGINISYVYSAMQLIDFPSGDEHKRYWISEYSKVTIPLPCPKEQTKIANFLTAIDDKITATQTQLKAVKQYKQGLLQQMFV